MKKSRAQLLALFLSAVLVFSLQPSNVWAKDHVSDDLSQLEDVQIDLSQSAVQRKEDKVVSEQKLAKGNISKTAAAVHGNIQVASVEDEAGSETESEQLPSTIYYGTMTGTLSATDDYLLYPANLTAGDYLQAKLTLPQNAQIDYDLLLFDSSLSLIKSSDYVTYLNEAGTLDESVGYLAATDEKVYVCVYSVGGGSATEAYTLNYSITTNFTDANEPEENAKEATPLILEGEDITEGSAEGILNSPIDNDWYSFTVLDTPAYNKIRFILSSSSTVNGCKFELYRNLVTSNYYGMQYIGTGTEGEIPLPAGTYYLRVVSTNTFDDFNASDIPTYNLTVAPVSRVDVIRVTEIMASDAVKVPYPEGEFMRVDQSHTQLVRVKGTAYYLGEYGQKIPAVNACISGEIEDQQWKEINRPDMATVYSAGIVNKNGGFKMYFNLNTALGTLTTKSSVSTHHYDLMIVKVYPYGNETLYATDKFYYLKYCDNF